MLVKLLTIMAGPNQVADAGSVVDLPDKHAKELLATNQAVPAPAAPTRKAPERATRQAPEHRDVAPREASAPTPEAPQAPSGAKPARERLV